MNPSSLITDLHGLPVTVMGLGTFGGAAGAVEFLCRHQARVTVTDLKDADELADQVAELDRLTAGAICWRLGGDGVCGGRRRRDDDHAGGLP